MKTMVGNLGLFLSLFLLTFTPAESSEPRFEDPGEYDFTYRVEDIEGEYETMSDSRIYYPYSSGSIPPSAIPCPIVVFGHGYMMGIDRYYSYAEHLASWGYVVVLPTFSNPLVVPEHYTRAKCMVDAAEFTASLNDVPGDPFYESLNPDCWGFTGHSMGGGCAFLAADTFDLTGTLEVAVNFCSPQTTPPVNPSNMDLPKLVLCGTIDTIAPWEEVREAMWEGTLPPGAFAVILGANHGYCMDYSYFWEDGGQATISREEQQRIIRLYLTAYMERYLHDDLSSWNYSFCYGDSILLSSCFDSVEVLLETSVSKECISMIGGRGLTITSLYPNPSSSTVSIIVSLDRPAPAIVRIVDITGRTVRMIHDRVLEASDRLLTWDGKDADGRIVPPGIYICILESEGTVSSRLLVRSKPD